MKRMELRLVQKPYRWSGIEGVDRCAFRPFDRKTGAPARFKFLAEVFRRFVWRFKQITIEPLELALDSFLAHDSFHEIDGRGVTLRCESRALLAVQLLQFVVPIIERIHNVRRGSSGHPAANHPVVDYHHASALTDKRVGDREPCNPGADYADIGSRVLAQRVELAGTGRGFPE